MFAGGFIGVLAHEDAESLENAPPPPQKTCSVTFKMHLVSVCHFFHKGQRPRSLDVKEVQKIMHIFCKCLPTAILA